MFDNLDLALTMLQTTSGLAGLTLVATGFIPLLAERAQGRYEQFVAEQRIRLLILLTKGALALFVASVLFSLAWSCILTAGWSVGTLTAVLASATLIAFIAAFCLVVFMVFRLLTVELFIR